MEQAQYGVRANCVCPGPIDTAWTHKETGAVDAEIEKALITATPLGRRGTPEEVANVYAFLASDSRSAHRRRRGVLRLVSAAQGAARWVRERTGIRVAVLVKEATSGR